jgi:hypothetical protein
VSDNVLIALINAAAMVLLLLVAHVVDRRSSSRRVMKSIESLRNRVSATESSMTAGLGAIAARIQRLEEGVGRLHDGQIDIRERLARLEGETAARKRELWSQEERAK